MLMTKYYIKDWMSNVLFGGKTFDSFEEGWEYIYMVNPEPEQDSPEWVDGWFDDYYVEEVEE
jgi:hypothetical protein